MVGEEAVAEAVVVEVEEGEADHVEEGEGEAEDSRVTVRNGDIEYSQKCSGTQIHDFAAGFGAMCTTHAHHHCLPVLEPRSSISLTVYARDMLSLSEYHTCMVQVRADGKAGDMFMVDYGSSTMTMMRVGDLKR